ncbi:MAG: 4-hydroxy-tetrahydrodipicolinate reductase [Lachnospiraceae bacterium]
MIKVIMHGCNGRMGQVISQICRDDSEVEIVAGIDVSDQIRNEYPVYLLAKDCDVKADVIIDFSTAKAVDSILDYSITKKLPIVLCTTGLSQEQLLKVEQAAQETAVLKSANMSLGINVLMNLLKSAVKVLNPAGFDVEIIEKHHNQKLDAPSGTALALADSMNEAMDHKFEYVLDRSQSRQKREKEELGISAVRGGTIVGEHEVIFAGTDEVVEIKHTAYSRSIFAKGAVEAAKFLAGKKVGSYDMQDVVSS